MSMFPSDPVGRIFGVVVCLLAAAGAVLAIVFLPTWLACICTVLCMAIAAVSFMGALLS